MGLAAAAGVATVVALGYAQTKVDFLRSNWYAAPLVLAAGGLLLAKRMPTIAVALVAGAGIFGYMGYQANAAAVAQAGGGAKPAAAGFGAYGFSDAGAYHPMMRSDSGMFERAHPGAGALMGAGMRGQLIARQAGALMGAGAEAAVSKQGGYGSASGLSD